MEQPTQPTGMMGQLPSNAAPASPEPKSDAQAGYNGPIVIDGDPVEVKQGVGVYDDEEFYVSDDGSVVIDDERNIVGRIEGDTFVPVDEAYAEKLREMGVLE